MSKEIVFDKRQTNISKGVAVLLLLWHHLFFNSEEKYSQFTSLFYFRDIPIECFIADFCKVCVAVFLFLSGYGMYKSFEHYNKKYKGAKNYIIDTKYVVKHLLRLLSDYWFIFIIFVPLGCALGKKFFIIYDNNPIKYLADFFGLSYLLFEYDATMNATWWFMSIIIAYYILFPLLYKIQKYSQELLFLLSAVILFIVPDFRQLTIWLLPFTFGMYIAGRNGFETLSGALNNKTKVLFAVILVVLIAYLRFAYFGNGVNCDFLFAFSIILFSYFILSKIPIINKILEIFGKYSGSIFMFHTFIYSYYFHSFIYSFKYSVFIYIVMAAVCCLVAVLLDLLKKVIKYDKLINNILMKIENGVREKEKI